MPQISWKLGTLKHQIGVLDGKFAPDIIITNATYLHSLYKDWRSGNIWIAGDRILYVGDRLPDSLTGIDMYDAAGQKIVPGYIEPHVHPFMLYRPDTFAGHAAKSGTTAFISDNLLLFMTLTNKKAFSILRRLNQLPFSFYWWARLDSQTEMPEEDEMFRTAAVEEWLERDDVLLAGELTGWPKLLSGNDRMLGLIQEARDRTMRIEGHLPGASDRTLAKMKILGVDGDHEAMTLADVEKRLLHGYKVTLRNSSIRPDLPHLLKEIVDARYDVFDHLMMTTDGSSPAFYKGGVMDECIRIALDAGVKPIDAYLMASFNVAKHYDMTGVHGIIATGRIASLNFLDSLDNPTPVSVLSRGAWAKRDGEDIDGAIGAIEWDEMPPYVPDFELTEEDFHSSPIVGIELVNDVITKPYRIHQHAKPRSEALESDECHLVMIDRLGKWRVNTVLKGFADRVQGFASTFSNTGDILLIGKVFSDMIAAFNEVKRLGGGIALAERGAIIAEIPLSINGFAFRGEFNDLIVYEERLRAELAARGFDKGDFIYMLQFLQATHLPYIRTTQLGLFDVMNRSVILPRIDR